MPRTGGTGGGNTQALSRYAFALYIYSKVNPEIWDFIVPKGPKYSKGTLSIIASQILKFVSQEIKSAEIGRELTALGKSLYSYGLSNMSYEMDDWRCGNEPFPIPHFGIIGGFSNPLEEVQLNPQPQPPHEKYYAGILNLVADSIGESKMTLKLRELSQKLIDAEEHSEK